MKTLFEPCQAGNLQLASRIVMAPLTRNRAPHALANALMAEYYAQRAKPATGAGLIITEATAISHQGQGYADVPGIWSSAQVASWKPVTAAVHAQGGKIVMQLWHVGRVSHHCFQPHGNAPVAPSAITAKTKTVQLVDGVPTFMATSEPRALSVLEIPGIVADYKIAAQNAMAAGFDGVEVHAANGYLIDQFLRSDSNHRTDAYGGSIENRTRFLKEAMLAVCDAIGSQNCGIRISPVTPANDVADPEPQALFEHVAAFLGTLNLAYVHTIEGSTGAARDFYQGPQPFDYLALKAAYLRAGGKGAWMLNNAYSLELANQALNSGADLVAFGRPFIANPDLGLRLQQNGPFNEPDRSTFYGGLDKGYTNYPFLNESQPVFQGRRVEQQVIGQATRDGDGVKLTRVLTQAHQRRLDPFLMLDNFGSDDPNDYGGGFPDHPHRGFETVTYMIAGRMRHRDSAGHEGLLQNGGVQWMTAGRGVVHSEMPEQEEGVMEGFQLWLNLPSAQKMCIPDYQDIQSDKIPELELASGIKVRIIAGQSHGIVGAVNRDPILFPTQALYLDIHFDKQAHFQQNLSPDHNAFLFVYRGHAKVISANQETTVGLHRMAILQNEGTGVEISATAGTKLLLIAGKPLNEPIAQYGPFVMNTREELMQAVDDFRAGLYNS